MTFKSEIGGHRVISRGSRISSRVKMISKKSKQFGFEGVK